MAIPRLPGVPALNSYAPFGAIVQLFADAVGLSTNSLVQQWGLFQDGIPVIVADTVVSFDYKNDWSISDYPMEQGAFASYDKVETPYTVRIRFSTGGSVADREAFLESILSIAGNLELYDAVTPEKVYQGVNIARVDYSRKSNQGNGLLIVDIACVEIRETAEASFTNSSGANGLGTNGTANSSTGGAEAPIRSLTNTKSPFAASPINGGTVQTSAPTTQQQSFVEYFQTSGGL